MFRRGISDQSNLRALARTLAIASIVSLLASMFTIGVPAQAAFDGIELGAGESAVPAADVEETASTSPDDDVTGVAISSVTVPVPAAPVAQDTEPETDDTTAPPADGTTEPASVPAAAATTPATPTLDLSLTVTPDRDPVLAGSFVNYAIEATNNGDAPADNVVVTIDEVPFNATFAAMNGCALANTTYPECHLDDLAAGESRSFTLIVEFSEGAAGPATLTATVDSQSEDADPTNNAATAEVLVNSRPAWRDVAPTANVSIVSVDVNGNAGVATYTVIVGNAGPNTAEDVTLNDLFPESTVPVNVTGCDVDTEANTCTIGTVAPGATTTIVITVATDPTAPPPPPATTATSTTPDPDGTDNTATTAPTTELGAIAASVTTVPAGAAQTFVVTGDVAGTLSDGGSALSSGLAEGTYTATLAAAAGWAITDITCSDADSSGDTTTGEITYVVSDAETTTCAVTTTQLGSVTITKSTVSGNGSFGFTGDLGSFTLTTTANTASTTFADVLPGTYAVTETDPTGLFATLTAVVCDDADSASPSTGDVAASTATINVEPDEAIECTFTNVFNLPPEITSDGGGLTATTSVAENTTAVTDVEATDAEGDTEGGGLTYSLNGADAGLFTIDAAGVVSLTTAPDFENPADADGDNVYEVTVTVTDTATLSDSQALSVSVTDENEAPSVRAAATASTLENTSVVTDVNATDPEGETESGGGLSYSLSGADAGAFAIDAAGELSFASAPDFENPTDTGGDNTYDVTVTVTDSGSLSDSEAIVVSVTDGNEKPSLSNSLTSASLAEDFVGGITNYDATDPEGETEFGGGLTYSISGDSGPFSIDTEGRLASDGSHDFENPTDADTDNTYVVTVTVTDSGGLTDTQDIAITITDVNEAPSVTGGSTASVTVVEGSTAATNVDGTDPEGETESGGGLSYSLSGGDVGAFAIDASGALTFSSTPDFENPTDTGGDNTYDVTVTVTDSGGLTGSQDIAVTVTDNNEEPTISGLADATYAENDTSDVDDAAGSDPEGETESGGGLSYSLSGDDAGEFSIDAAGVLTFDSAPDFENPTDTGDDNTYDVTVTVADSGGLTDSDSITITVTDVNEAPSVTGSATVDVAESTTSVADLGSTDPEGETDAGGGLAYSLTGDDAGDFSISASGVLTFDNAPDFENPTDTGGDNTYDVTVTVTDSGALSGTLPIAVSVTDEPDPPAITSNGGGATAAISIVENTTAVTDVNATDPEGDTEGGGGLTYSLTGDDAGDFDIDASGVLTFTSAPDHDAPGDDDGDNVYDVRVTVTDSEAQTDLQDLSVTVTGVNEQPSITVPATINVAENTTAVADVNATDPEGDTEGGGGLTYSLTGIDAGDFDIDASGALTFNPAPDFENPADTGGDNTYDITVTVTDSGTLTDSQAIAVTVTNAPDAPVITSDGGGDTASLNIAEVQLAVTDVNATDDEGDAEAAGLGYTIGGADAGLFTLDGVTGQLSFSAAPNFENPIDDGVNNIYDVTVTVTDSQTLTDTQSLAITVTNVNETPSITSNSGAPQTLSVVENTTAAVTNIDASDLDGETENGGGLTYSLTGDDAGDFAIDATGALTFNPAPDFETPADTGTDNTYDLNVVVTDVGGLTDSQTITVSVTGVNEAPSITSNGGGATAAITVFQGATSVTDVQASDPEGETENGGGLSYGLSGADASAFNLDAGTGVLSFASAPTAAGTFDITVTVSDSGPLSATQDITVTVPANTAPVAVDDTYTGLPINVQLAAGTTTSAISVNASDGVLTQGTDDNDAENNTLSVTGIVGCADGTAPFEDCATSGGGTVSMNANGTFTYVSQPGESAASDTFTYTLSDGIDTDMGTVTITFGTDTIWFLDAANTGFGATGTSVNPFPTVDFFNGTAADEANDIIYVTAGSYVGDGFSLLPGQEVLGAPAGLTSGALTIAATGANPTLSTTAGNGNAIDLNMNNTVRSIDIANTPAGNTAIAGTAFGSPVISGVNVSGTGAILDLTNGNVTNIALGTQASTTTSIDGISLDNVTGTYTAGGPITIAGATGRGIDIANSSATFNFASAVDVTGTVSTGVAVQNNTGTTTFADLDVNNSSTNQQAITTTGAPLTITTGTANGGTSSAFLGTNTALNVNLVSLSSNGGNQVGIGLTNVTGSFAVTGNGGGCATSAGGAACSGGTITGKSDDGVQITNAATVSLTSMEVSGSTSGNGIESLAVQNLTLNDMLVRGNNNSGVQLAPPSGASGTLNVTSSTFHDNRSRGVSGIANGAGTTITVNVSTSTFTSSSQAANAGQFVAIDVAASGTSTANYNIANNPQIAGSRGNAINVFTNGSANSSGTISGNTVGTATTSSGSLTGSGIRVSNEGSGTATTSVTNNTVQEIGDGNFSGFEGLFVSQTVAGGTMNATVTNNSFSQIRDDRAMNLVALVGVMCTNVSGNTFSNTLSDPRLRQVGSGVMSSTAANEAALETAHGNQNFDISGTVTFNAATCPTP